MQVSRRSILRGLGALTAANAMPALASPLRYGGSGEGGGLQAPALDKDAVYVLFEGPWIISHDGDKLVAATFSNKSHVCEVGNWSPSPKLQNVPASAKWVGTLDARSTAIPTFDSLAKSLKTIALYISDPALHLTPTTTDIYISLPMPDEIAVAGQISAVATVKNVTVNSHTSVTTILKYNKQNNMRANLSFVQEDQTKTLAEDGSEIALVSTSHIVFRRRYADTASDLPAEQTTHIQQVFELLSKKITKKSGGAISASLAVTDPTPLLDVNSAFGFGQNDLVELGLHAPARPMPHSAPKSVSMPHGPTRAGHLASCAGGTILLGP